MMEDNDLLGHDDPSDALTECAETFVDGKYGRCAEQAIESMQQWGIGVVQAQLAIMSYQRLEGPTQLVRLPLHSSIDET